MVYVTRKGLKFSPLKSRVFLAVGLASTALTGALYATPDALTPEDFPAGFFSQGTTHSGAVFSHKPAIIQGKIFMRRQTAALPHEELDARIARIAGGIATEKQKETKDFAQRLTEHEVALLEQETNAKINQASTQALSQLQETELALKSYTNSQLAERANTLSLEVAKLRQQADVAEERAKRYSAEKTLDMRESLLVKLAEQQAALREAESRIASKFDKTETGLLKDFNQLQSAVQVAQAENKRYTAEQLLAAQRMLSAVDAENVRRTWQAMDLVQARQSHNKSELENIRQFVELGPQLAEERAKRFALEQNDILQRDVKDTLRETQLAMAVNQADVSKRLADLRGEVAVRAEESKRYAAEQANSNRVAMLETRQHMLDRINDLEQQLTVADASSQAAILSKLQDTRAQLQQQDAGLQLQLAALAGRVDTRAAEAKQFASEQANANRMALMEARQSTKDQINRLERELAVADAASQAAILSKLQETRAQLQQQDAGLQLQLAALAGKVDTRTEEAKLYTAQQTYALGQNVADKWNQTQRQLAQYQADTGKNFANVQGQINTTAAENKRYTAEQIAANRMALLESREQTMAEIQRLEHELVAADARTQQTVLAQLQQNLSQLKAQDASLQNQVVALSGQVDTRTAEAKRYLAEQTAATQRNVAAFQAQTAEKLAALSGKVDTRAAENKQYTAEQIAATTAELLENRRKTQTQLMALEQAFSAADAASKAEILAQVQQTRSSLQQQDATLQSQLTMLSGQVNNRTAELKTEQAIHAAQTQAQLQAQNADVQTKLAALAGRVDTRAAESKQYTAEQIGNSTATMLENREKTLAEIQRLEAELISSDAILQANVLAQLQNTREQLQQQDAVLQTRLTAMDGTINTRAEEGKRYTAEQIAQTQAQLAESDANLLKEVKGTQAQVKDITLHTTQRLAETEKEMLLTRQYADNIAKQESLAAEERLRRFASLQLSKLESETETALNTLSQMTAQDIINTRKIAAQKAADVEVAVRKYTEEKAAETLSQSNQTAEALVEATRMTDAEVKQIAEETLEGQSDVIRALAMQTLAESDDYIKTVARQAVQDDDPAMKRALAQAAKQVILDENNNVAFAIREVVGDEIDQRVEERLAESGLVANDGRLSSAENISAGRIGVAPIANEPINGASPNQLDGIVLRGPRHRQDWINIRDYHLVVHVDNKTLDEILQGSLKRAEPFVGPWKLKWKIKDKHKDILDERFSLDAETTFEEFANYLAQYLFNTRGVMLNFKMFDAERVLVVSDE